MKFALIQTATGYVAKVWDETRMVPDPAFGRAYLWAAPPPQQEGEFEQDFAARRADYHAQIEREAQLLYAAEFTTVEEVQLTEKEIDPFNVEARPQQMLGAAQPIAPASRQAATTKGGANAKTRTPAAVRRRKR